LNETCLLFAEDSLELPATKAQIVKIPLAKTASAIDKKAIGVVALAAMLALTGIFPAEAFKRSIARFQAHEIAQTNLAAFLAGTKLAGT